MIALMVIMTVFVFLVVTVASFFSVFLVDSGGIEVLQ
jgi:hypothetical protein